jgi:hypothetical protein
MNAKIMIGAGIAVFVWGGTALAYGDSPTGAALLAIGVVLVVIGLRQLRRQ